jgi:hypothetical protein
VDYSHGIRLVHRTILIDGEPHDLRDVLTDPARAALVGPDAVIRFPFYPPLEPSAVEP